MNRFVFMTLVMVGSALVWATPADAKKRQKEPDLFDECPVKETIRVASENSLAGLAAFENCDDVEVAEADPDEIRVRAPVRFAPMRRESEVDANAPDVIDPTESQMGRKSVVAAKSSKSKKPQLMSAGVTQTGTQFVRIVPPQPEIEADLPQMAVAPQYAVQGSTNGPLTAVPAPNASAMTGDSILVMRPQSYATTHDALIAEIARRHRVDPLLLHAVIKQESGYKQRARSWVGARGLMQIMPGTGAMLGVRTEHLEDPEANVDAGARLLRKLAIRYNGNFDLVLAAYNAGEGAVQKYGNRIPPYKETQNYVRAVMAHYNKLLVENIGQSIPK